MKVKKEETKKRRRQNETEFSKNHFQNRNFHRKKNKTNRKPNTRTNSHLISLYASTLTFLLDS